MRKYDQTVKGVSSRMIRHHRERNKIKNFPPPDYTLEEFRIWLAFQSNFVEIFVEWVESGYEKTLKSSVDRIDESLPYRLDNIQLMTWGDNHQKELKRQEKERESFNN